MTRRSLLALAAGAGLRAADDFPRLLDTFARPLGAELGFAMLHVETGEEVSIRGGERFPMASVYKLPIAIEALARIESGDLALDRTVRLTPADLRLGLGDREVEKLVGDSGHDFAIGELIERMLVDSDNACSDAMLDLLGPDSVTRRMASLGVPEIRVDRPEFALLLDYIGVSSTPPPDGWSLPALRERYASAGPGQRTRAQAAFLEDPRDTATPRAMVELLARVHRREVPQAERLLGWMARCKTGGRRLRGEMPETVVFAHRTGTTDTTDGVTAASNDVGILTLPDGAGTAIVAAFLRMARGSMDERERALARIGRAVFERYAGA